MKDQGMLKTQLVREAWKEAFSLLQHGQIPDASFEAELLLRHLLKWTRAEFFSRLHEEFPSTLQSTLHEWVERRLSHEPIQYILGEQEFYGRSFFINSSVLVPRPETEILIEKTLEKVDRVWRNKPIHVLDVGTGSGVIAITIAKERPLWEVTALDISKEALNVAKRNAAYHGVESHIKWVHGEYLAPMQEGLELSNPIDVVISNPPYIPSNVFSTLDIQVREYEPRIALEGGEDGLDAYKELVQQLKKKDLGTQLLCLEIGAEQGNALVSIISEQYPKADIAIYPDLAGHDRVVIADLQV